MAVKSYNPYELDKPENETGLAVSIASGIGSGLVKIPLGLVSVAAEIYDATQGEGVPYNESAVARLENFIDDSVVGQVVQGLEDRARDTAAGKITEALVQLGIPAARGAKIAGNIAAKTIKGIKNGNRVSLKNKNLAKGMRKADQLNRGARLGRFAATATGGAAGASLVYDVEDIGTFGDVFDLGTGLDRDAKRDTDDEALRRLENRAKFLLEGVAIAPFAYGAGKVAGLLAEKGKNLAFSNSTFERLVDKYIAAPFRPRGKKTQELFEAQMKVEGQEGAAAIVAKDLLRDVDESFKGIFNKSTDVAARTKNTDEIVTRMDELLKSGTDAVKKVGGKDTFKFVNFGKKELKEFYNSLDNIKIPKKQQQELVSTLTNSRNAFNALKTNLLQGGNLQKGNKELSDFFSNRLRYTMSNDYKIFENKKLIKINQYVPTNESKEKVAQLFINYAKANNTSLTKKEALLEVDDILKTVKMDKVTRSPVFRFETKSALYDGATQEVNISRAISFNKFDKKDLITGQKDLKAFRELFGEIKDARRTITNTMQSLSSVAAKDQFFNTILRNGKIVFDTPNAVSRNLPNRELGTRAREGMQIPSPLGEQFYTNPLNGKFTTREFEDAIKFAEQLPGESLMKNAIYRYLVAIPKGLAQVSKTVLGPFTHMRNFTSAVAFSLGTGNLFKDPRFVLSNFKKSFNTIQPQLLYRNLPKDQAEYRFLLEEGVVNSSSTFQDVQGLLKDIAKGGDVIERVFGKLGKTTNKLFKGAQDLYVAEDDFYKIYNFYAEFDNLKNAFRGTRPDLELAREAAKIVRNTVPNYAYVSDFVKGLRRSPLGNFVSFPAEIIRTSFNIVEQGIKEMKNPALRSIGARRLIGYGTAVSIIPPAVTEIFRGIYGFSRDEVAALRRFLPEWSRESTIIPNKDKDGNLYYTDFSHGFAYDTVVNPIQSVIANVEGNDEEPLIKGMVEGSYKAIGRLVEPFISESIWIQALQDLYARGGRTDTGSQVWNPRDPAGDKMFKGLRHLSEALLPLSAAQLRRLGYAAALGEDPKTGRDLSFAGELAGFFGFRNIKMDIPESLGYKITGYSKALRQSRGFLPRPRGSKDTTQENILKRFVEGNRSWFKASREMNKDIEAMRDLGYDDKEIGQIFDKRNLSKDFNALSNGQFKPFDIPDGLVEEYIRNAEENGYDNPMTPEFFQELNEILRELNQLYLDDVFPDFFREAELPGPMATNPMPNVQPTQVAQALPQTGGLTQTEAALLSPEEQIIRQRTRT
tara:strand:+ start:816 stop:4604 length:3789 start_codon:yes stop_codon:yes gene_type:complete